MLNFYVKMTCGIICGRVVGGTGVRAVVVTEKGKRKEFKGVIRWMDGTIWLCGVLLHLREKGDGHHCCQ